MTDKIELTEGEIDDIIYFIDNSLSREWDQYTNHFICGDSCEDGKRRMNPQMYDLMWKLRGM